MAEELKKLRGWAAREATKAKKNEAAKAESYNRYGGMTTYAAWSWACGYSEAIKNLREKLKDL